VIEKLKVTLKTGAIEGTSQASTTSKSCFQSNVSADRQYSVKVSPSGRVSLVLPFAQKNLKYFFLFLFSFLTFVHLVA
jgi:hypothetical protein